MRRLFVGVLFVLLSLTSTWVAITNAAAEPPVIDNNSQESVRQAYLTRLYPALQAPRTWNGDASKCTDQPQAQPAAAVGMFSSAGQAATFDAINYYRAMAGLQPVTENQRGSDLAQQAALIMHANGELTHVPTRLMACFSEDGYIGASTSNLSLGHNGAAAIGGQMDDYGPGNTAVGHRRWLLYPTLSQAGAGSTSNTESTVVMGEGAVWDNPRPAGGTAWPPAGFVPWEIAPTSGRWSYSAPAAELLSAQVSMTKNGAPLTATIASGYPTYGDYAVVWETGPIEPPALDAVDIYGITISDIPGGPVSYQVKVFRAGVATVGGVTIQGDPVIGTTLTAVPSNVDPVGAQLAYRWYADGTEVGQGATYRVRPADGGEQLVVKVTASQPAYNWLSGPVTASSARAVPMGVLTPPAGVGIQGTPKVGEQLRFPSLNWGTTLDRIDYQWMRDGEPIAGATDPTYQPTPADTLTRISVEATAYALGYTPKTMTTEAVGPVGSTARASSVTVKGEPVVGNELIAAAQEVFPANAYVTYRWLRNGTEVELGERYVPTVEDVGATLQVRADITMLHRYWDDSSVQSDPLTVRARPTSSTPETPPETPKEPAPEPTMKLITTPTPKISGTAKVGKTLTAKPGTWKPSGVSFEYQWYRNGARIVGATASSYPLQGADKGKKITVGVTGSKDGYRPVGKTSKATKKVASGTLAGVKPKITGTPLTGSVLTAVPGTWKPAEVALSYQWYRNGKKIKSATASSYTLTIADKGKKITVKVTGKASGYTTATKTSSKTKKVK